MVQSADYYDVLLIRNLFVFFRNAKTHNMIAASILYKARFDASSQYLTLRINRFWIGRVSIIVTKFTPDTAKIKQPINLHTSNYKFKIQPL